MLTLHLQRQPHHTAPHIRPTKRQPHPHIAPNRDHRPTSAFNTAAANPGGAQAPIRA